MGLYRKVQRLQGEELLFLESAIAHEVVDIEERVLNSLNLFSHKYNFLTDKKNKIHNNKLQKYTMEATAIPGKSKNFLSIIWC